MFFSIRESIDVIIMTLAVGYIFIDLFSKHPDRKTYLFSCLVTAPALFLHELGHKFTALAFGIQATFHAAYFWLALGLLLKIVRFPILFFVPAYVSIDATSATPLQNALIAGAGPFTNLLLFLTATLLLRKRTLKARTYAFLEVSRKLNLFLFAFNMIPLPPFDGYTFFSSLIKAFF